MKILHLIPLCKLPKIIPPIISYFSKQDIKEGALVLVLINRRPVIALVLKSEDVTRQKINIKKMSFTLKGIKKNICAQPVLTSDQIKIISFISKNLCLTPNLLAQTSLKWLPKNYEKIPKFLEKRGLNSKDRNFATKTSEFGTQNFYPRTQNTAAKKPQDKHETAYQQIGIYGKNRQEKYVYFIQKILEKKSALFIAPTLSYAEYFYNNLKNIFGENIIFLNPQKHSLKIYDDLFFKKNPSPRLVISTKLAILYPWKNLGIVVIEKESANFYNFAYRQAVNFKQAILYFAQIYNIPCILADDFPSLESYFEFKSDISKLKTPEVLNRTLLEKTEIIDLNQEKKLDKNIPLSQSALSIIKDSLRQEKKLMIFINKKGYSKSVICRKCGFVLMCPKCGLNLSAEKTNEQKIGLFCKNCFFRKPLPDWCPKCEADDWNFVGLGTEHLESALKKLLFANKQISSQTQIFRLDKNIAPNKKRFQKIIDDFSSIKSGILITTRIIFNQPNLKVDNVLIISSDTAFFIPDYVGTEKILNNFIELENYSKEKVFWQTYQKNHPSTLSFYHKTFESFAEKELNLRQQFHFPPFAQIIKIKSSAKNSFLAKKIIEDFVQNLRFQNKDLIDESIFISSLQPDRPFLIKGIFSYIIEIKVSSPKSKKCKGRDLIFNIIQEARDVGLEINML
jgi:primosomal protein N' (replication factor Y)